MPKSITRITFSIFLVRSSVTSLHLGHALLADIAGVYPGGTRIDTHVLTRQALLVDSSRDSWPCRRQSNAYSSTDNLWTQTKRVYYNTS